MKRFFPVVVFACVAGACIPASVSGCASSTAPSNGAPSGDSGAAGPAIFDAATNLTPDAAAPSDAASDGGGGSDAGSDSGFPDSGATGDGADADGDACTGSIAVVGGTVSGASTIAFAATLGKEGGAWSVSSLPTNVASPPAVSAYGGGFVVVFVDATGDLEFSTSSWSWSSPAAVAGVTAMSAPSLAIVGGSLHLVYQGADGKYYHGVFTAGAGWDAANDPIGGAAKQGFGPSAPVAESVAGDLVIAYGGQDGFLYDETWADGAWVPDNEHATAQIGTLSPAIAALQGGTSDTLVVYANAGGTLYSTSRAGGVWSPPAVVNANAFTDAAPSLLALSGGRAMMTYLGTNSLPYYSVYDPSSSPPWTSPAAIGASTATLTSPPSIAPGVCGDDAVVALTGAAGVVTLRYANGAWQPPIAIDGTAGMTFASVASQP